MKRSTKVGLAVVGVVAVVVATAVARPACVLGKSAVTQHKDKREAPPPGFADDASRLNKTAVRETYNAPSSMDRAESALRELLARARDEGIPMSIAGARHTQGGHTIAADGIVVDMTPLNGMTLDAAKASLHVEAGARWSEIIRELDPEFSVAIMQSNDTFSVGGSLGANCHGWQTRRPPIASTVRSFRLMKADGEIVRCSREENPELFAAALGGYGLFGIVLDVELSVVRNARMEATRQVMPLVEYPAAFERGVVGDSTVALAFGRLSIVPGAGFLHEAILTTFRPSADQSDLPPLSEAKFGRTKRTVFRASVYNDYGKQLRWKAERLFGEHLSARVFTRNDLLSEGVEIYENRSADTTDILHEYFVPRGRFIEFVDSVRELVPRHGANLLNVTVRDVVSDEDALLRYADADMFAFVMLFNQPMTRDGEHSMQALTRDLIEAALSLGGRHYLPYRLHATVDQLKRGYPQITAFLAAKRRFDPEDLFQNGFYSRYAGS